MKDIDFLPEWYKNGVRREVSYRTQYMALGGVFLVMVVWSFVATRSIAKARAEFDDMSAMHTQAEKVSAELAVIQNKLKSSKKKVEYTEQIDSRIEVAGVLGEMSFLIEKSIVVNKVELVAEKFPDKKQDKASAGGSAVVRAVRIKVDKNQRLPLGQVRFKVVVGGVAADASDVAALICKLEDSPYFCQVVLSFSRSAEVNVESILSKSGSRPDAGANITVSEFEIHCYLANYLDM
ncbi:MAG: hypothetical protein AMJ65_10455 [Phycisphaerae bacterium SG8_4]|nr:MAG: hypothetical protein AMJ65_10455 [Phycisphaerae bacterium SG8_4]